MTDSISTSVPNGIPLSERPARAVNFFMQGYGCAQSVFMAFSDLYGIPQEQAARLAAGFGGGVGRLRMMCGAVSALVMLVGLEEGQTRGDDREGKSHCYSIVQQLLHESEEINGSLICAEILGLKGFDKAKCSPEASARTQKYYKTRPCAAKVEIGAQIFMRYLQGKGKG